MNDPLGTGTGTVPPAEGDDPESIAARAAAGEAEQEQEQLPGVLPLEGDKQLTLAGLGPRGMAIESEVSVMSAAVPTKGLLDPDRRGMLLVAYVPQQYTYVPVRENSVVKRWKLRQTIRPANIVSADGLSGVEAVVMNCVQNGISPDAILEAVNAALAAALRS